MICAKTLRKSHGWTLEKGTMREWAERNPYQSQPRKKKLERTRKKELGANLGLTEGGMGLGWQATSRDATLQGAVIEFPEAVSLLEHRTVNVPFTHSKVLLNSKSYFRGFKSPF